jgi:hypothetical protein
MQAICIKKHQIVLHLIFHDFYGFFFSKIYPLPKIKLLQNYRIFPGIGSPKALKK